MGELPDPISQAILTTEIPTPCGAWSLRWPTGALNPFSNGIEFAFFLRISLQDSKQVSFKRWYMSSEALFGINFTFS